MILTEHHLRWELFELKYKTSLVLNGLSTNIAFFKRNQKPLICLKREGGLTKRGIILHSFLSAVPISIRYKNV